MVLVPCRVFNHKRSTAPAIDVPFRVLNQKNMTGTRRVNEFLVPFTVFSKIPNKHPFLFLWESCTNVHKFILHCNSKHVLRNILQTTTLILKFKCCPFYRCVQILLNGLCFNNGHLLSQVLTLFLHAYKNEFQSEYRLQHHQAKGRMGLGLSFQALNRIASVIVLLGLVFI